MEVRENVELKNFTTFKIGGPARYFCVAKSKEDLLGATSFAKKNKIKFFILGGGSNLLVSDKGYNGLVIKLQVSSCKLQAKNEIHAEAGTPFAEIVKLAVENNLSGTEWALGIPRMTVGGAVFGNAQAFGAKTSQITKQVEVLDSKTNKIKILNNKQCKFSLKSSIFKKENLPAQAGNLIILSAVFKLEMGDKEKIKQKIKEFLVYRKSHHPMNFPSAGSVFVNPERNGKVIPAGFLIEQCGFKGKKIGGAQFSEKHANFIINLGGAKSSDVLKLINLAKKKVRQKFGIDLATEIQILK